MCLQEAPNVLDMIAVGFAKGRICVLNAREDRVLMEFEQAQGRVTTLSWRSGDASAPAHLISGAANGAIVVWDLEKRRAHHVLEDAHQGPVTRASFLPNQPILLTGGLDNALRMWIFDTLDGTPRLLRERCGCPGPARKMKFYGKGDRELIVGGGSLQGTGFVARVSFIQDHQNKEYSQGALRKISAAFRANSSGAPRLPPLLDFAVCEGRHFDWPAMVTAHERTDAALVWSARNQAMLPSILQPPEARDRAPVTAVAISACGNYCVIGLENGGLHRFNLQSQLHRGSIPKPPELVDEANKPKAKASASRAPRAHHGRVSGLEITVSGEVVSVGAHPHDCNLKLWGLATHKPLGEVSLTKGRLGTPSCLILRTHGSLGAVGLDDGALLIVELLGRTVVRNFACGVPATDVAFSAEGRWLAAALRGGGLRIFDLPAARCVDSFSFARPALGVCFSPSTAFLLTSHAKGNAVQVWANKFLFDPSLSAPLLRPEPEEPINVDEPGAPALAEGEDEEVDDGDTAVKVAGKTTEHNEGDAKPLESDLFTLSNVPPAKWMATLHLDVVKERNKSVEPAKPLPNAPFFLPTTHEGVVPKLAPLGASTDTEGDNLAATGVGDAATAFFSHVVRQPSLADGTQFQKLLRSGDFDAALGHLRSQTPSGVHLAMEQLGPMAGGDDEELGRAMRFFLHHLSKAHFADELQAFLSIFLQAHGEDLAESAELRNLCAKLRHAQEQLWTNLDAQCQKARCFLGMLTHTQSQW